MCDFKPITDTIQVKVEDDGTITIVTGKMSAEVHQTAEQFLTDVEKLSGGVRQDTRLAQEHQHNHEHHHHHNHDHNQRARN